MHDETSCVLAIRIRVTVEIITSNKLLKFCNSTSMQGISSYEAETKKKM